MKKLLFFTITIIFLMSYSCTPKIDGQYIKSLHQTMIPHSVFEISIPDNYSLIESQGTDFNVYYIQPHDTANKKLFTAGLYLGNNPGGFGKTKSGCKLEKRKTAVMETETEWSVYDCNGQFFLETIVENKYHKGGDDFVHAFGNAVEKRDVEHILAIFSTLINKKQ